VSSTSSSTSSLGRFPTIEEPEPGGTPIVRPFELPDGKKHHYFICHHQGSGGDQAHNLCLRLRSLGFEVWYDNEQEADERNLAGMKKGVRESVCLLIFLSGRHETDNRPDPEGEYEGVFTRWYCHEEMNEAHVAGLKVVGVQEHASAPCRPDFALERSRALSAGRDADGNPAPISPHAEQNLELLQSVCFDTLFERKKAMVDAMMKEIVRLTREAPHLRVGTQAEGMALKASGRTLPCRITDRDDCETLAGTPSAAAVTTFEPEPEPEAPRKDQKSQAELRAAVAAAVMSAGKTAVAMVANADAWTAGQAASRPSVEQEHGRAEAATGVVATSAADDA
jgi:hypothetical protein